MDSQKIGGVVGTILVFDPASQQWLLSPPRSGWNFSRLLRVAALIIRTQECIDSNHPLAANFKILLDFIYQVANRRSYINTRGLFDTAYRLSEQIDPICYYAGENLRSHLTQACICQHECRFYQGLGEEQYAVFSLADLPAQIIRRLSEFFRF